MSTNKNQRSMLLSLWYRKPRLSTLPNLQFINIHWAARQRTVSRSTFVRYTRGRYHPLKLATATLSRQSPFDRIFVSPRITLRSTGEFSYPDVSFNVPFFPLLLPLSIDLFYLTFIVLRQSIFWFTYYLFRYLDWSWISDITTRKWNETKSLSPSSGIKSGLLIEPTLQICLSSNLHLTVLLRILG